MLNDVDIPQTSKSISIMWRSVCNGLHLDCTPTISADSRSPDATNDEPHGTTVGVFKTFGKSRRLPSRSHLCRCSSSRLRVSRRSNEHARFADRSRKRSQEESSDCVAHLLLHESNSWGRDSRARRGVGTLRLNRRGSLMVSGQVLADEAGHFEPKLKGSIGEGSNHSNFSDQSSVKILSESRRSC